MTDKIREEIQELQHKPPRKENCKYKPYDKGGLHYDPFVSNPICAYCFADQILSIKGIRIEAENQELPCNCASPCVINTNSFDEGQRHGYYQGLGDMLKEGWVKCLKKEEYG